MNTTTSSRQSNSTTTAHGSSSRRQVLTSAAALAAGVGLSHLPAPSAAAQPADSDLAVMTRLLDAERQASELFRAGLSQFTRDEATGGDRLLATQPTLALIWQHERTHLAHLADVVEELGGSAALGGEEVAAMPDLATFLRRAAAMKRTQVAAYLEAMTALQDAELRTLAATILVVEAQHAAHLNERTGQERFWSEI